MPQTPNKGYEIQVVGSNTDTWGDVLNDSMISVADRNLGGIVTKTLSNTTVNLTALESQNAIVRLIGTLTANVLVTTLANGSQIVQNATSGAFTVTFQKLGVGSPVTIPQSTSAVIALDVTNGAIRAADNQTEFGPGTVIGFFQAAPPTGYTKLNFNNIATRITNGTGGTTGGVHPFDSVFATRGFSGTVGPTSLTIAQIPPHTHDGNPLGNNDGDAGGPPARSNQIPQGQTYNTTSAGGGQSHDHTLSINNAEFGVAFINQIICQKN